MKYGNSVNRIGNVFRSMYIPPDDIKLWGQIDYNLEKLSKVPRRRPGDRFPLGGALFGVFIGVILGIQSDDIMIILGSAFGGYIAGVLAGSFIAYLLLKR